MNDYVDNARTQPILNLQSLTGMYQDRLFHPPTQIEFEAEWLRRFSLFRQPESEYLVFFKALPLKAISARGGV